MTPERWQQVEEIFQAAVDLAPAERERYVAQACAADLGLRRDVETLLLQHDSASGLLEHPVYGSTELSAIESFVYDDEEDPMIGRRLGAYRIEREVGRGGMGAVYEALRVDNEFTLRVAIKLVKRGMDTDFILRRFRKERQILAALDHPYIARLLDGGTTDDGLPYFVMEYIEGQPLYRYCDAHNLSIAERLKLFLGVCDAVHYAHQKQVIHRDIKPSNVLVTSEGVPKLLDFGIAKLLNPELAGEITHDPTATAMRLMTPEYASPEQVQGGETTPTTDVYSLGVLLYELLTGHRPYRLVNRAPHEIARVICEEEPLAPSVIITRPEDLLPHLAVGGDEVTTLKQLFSTRNASVESLRRDLSGDLDTIMMRALRKEPEWRYQTAEQLRDDIARYLDGIAVSELPDSPRAHRAIQTEPIQTENSLAVLPLKLLDTGTGSDSGPDYLGTGLADVLITRLSAIRRFAVRPTSSVLRYGAQTDPLLAGRELGVAFVLDGRLRRAGDRIRVTIQLLSVRDGTAMWAEQFDEKFTDVLSLEDAISSRVAEAIVPHLSGDDRIRLAKRGTDDPQAHEAYLRGRYHWNTFTEEGFAKAVVCYHQAIAADSHYAVAYAGIAEYYNWLGIFGVLPHRDCSAAAYEAAATAVSIDPVLAEGHGALGQAILCRDFDWERAEQQLLRSLELNPNYADARVWYAFQLAMEGRFAESLREATIARQLDPLAVLSGLCLGFCTYQSRRFAEALAFCDQTLKSEPQNAMVLYCSSYALSQVGRHQEAIARASRAIEMIGKASHTLGRLASAYATAGDAARAELILAEMAEVALHRYISPYHLALVHCALGRKGSALDLLESAFQIKDAWIVWMAVEPELDSVRNDPRFVQLLRKLNHRLANGAAKPETQRDFTQSGSGVVSSADEQSRVTSPMSPQPDTLPSENEEARQLYAAGRYYATRRTAEGLKQAIPRLERAVELDPKFALAYAELADCYSLLNWYVEPAPEEAWPQARKAATNAVAADPDLAEAHAALGFVRLHYDRDWIDAEREFKKAIELKPTALVSHRWYSYNLSAMGRHDEALAEMQRAREISPQSAIVASGVANVLFLAGRFDEAIEACRKALELDPGGVAAHTVLRWTYERKGMHAEALAAFEQERVFAGDTPTTRAKKAHVLAAIGNTEEARRILEELLARRPKEWVTAYEIAVIYCLLGDNDNAFTWLDQAERDHAVGFTFARVDPNLERLRSDPRFAELMNASTKTVTQTAEQEDAQRTQSAQLR
ncbi:MAG TPA: protein kinase [Pyrinomonadaceae bacterium]|nr:protein kinase [Pyrinomonadaceae bacterium]